MDNYFRKKIDTLSVYTSSKGVDKIGRKKKKIFNLKI